MKHNRSGYQLREKRDKQCVVEKRILSRFSAIAVNDKGNLLESEKAYSQRQNQMFQLKRRAKNSIGIINKKIIVLENEQDANVGNKSNQQYGLLYMMLIPPKQFWSSLEAR